MTTTHLRDSVSNWIVEDSTPKGRDSSLRQSGTFSTPTCPPVSLDELFAERKKAHLEHVPGMNSREMLSKRNYPFQVQQQTVNPADIFSTIQSFTQTPFDTFPAPTLASAADFVVPPKKQQKLDDSTPFLDLSASSNDLQSTIDALFGFCDSDPVPTATDGVLAKGEPMEQPETPELDSADSPASPCPSSPELSAGEIDISVHMSFGKRGNGNQPWQTSGVAPPKIGKMRKISIELATGSQEPLTVQLRARTQDQDSHRHKGKLVLCSDDRCCVKSKVEGQRKPVIRCAERLTELELPPVQISEEQPAVLNFFLKPEWNGLGANKMRPRFDVIIELIDCATGAVHELLAWETELQSHKFESSHKAKTMENCADSDTYATSVLL